MIKTATALIAALLLLAGCSSSSGGSSNSGTLANASDIDAARASAAATTVPAGSPGKLPTNLTVTMGPTFTVGGTDTDHRWVAVPVRVENHGSTDEPMPQIGIVCEGSTELGGYYADSTISLTETVPAKSYREGVLNLERPGEWSAAGAPTCQTPAFVQATPLQYEGSTPPAVRVPIPDDVIAQLNG